MPFSKMATENTFLTINSLLIVTEAWSMALFVGFHAWLKQWKHLQSSILNDYWDNWKWIYSQNVFLAAILKNGVHHSNYAK